MSSPNKPTLPEIIWAEIFLKRRGVVEYTIQQWSRTDKSGRRKYYREDVCVEKSKIERLIGDLEDQNRKIEEKPFDPETWQTVAENRRFIKYLRKALNLNEKTEETEKRI